MIFKKDTKVSSNTHPPASTSHGKLGLIFDQFKLFTSMLQKTRKYPLQRYRIKETYQNAKQNNQMELLVKIKLKVIFSKRNKRKML